MQVLQNWKLHALALLITIIAEMIGIQRFGAVVFLPLLYALIMGLFVSIPSLKILTVEAMEKSADYLGIAVMLLMVKVGLGIGPKLEILSTAGLALML